MKTSSIAVLCVFALCAVLGAQTRPSVVQGTIKRLDAATRTAVVATANGAEEVIEFGDKTVVHGTVAASKDAFRGLKVGSEVVAQYTVTGSKKVAVEVDDLGRDGLKSIDGTITRVDAATRKVVVKLADGTEQTFDMAAHVAAETGRATVRYTEEAGRKIVHFFKK